LTSFDGDIAAVNRILDMQDGPSILVGHSYGGAIITEAGNNTHVAGLVYIAAHAPDKGETEADNGKRYPAAYESLVKGNDGFDFITPSMFYQDFAADQVFHAKRANSYTVEIPGASHSVYESHPKEVATLIMEAAVNASKSWRN